MTSPHGSQFPLPTRTDGKSIAIQALILGLVAFASYAYFYSGGGWNQNTRFDLVRAIVEHGTLTDRRLPGEHWRQGVQRWPLLLRQSARATAAGRAGRCGDARRDACHRCRSGVGAEAGGDLLHLHTVFSRAPYSAGMRVPVLDCAAVGSERQRCGVRRARDGTRNSDLGLCDVDVGRTRSPRRACCSASRPHSC